MLTYGIPPEFRGGVHYLFKTSIRHRVSPVFIGSCNCVPMAFIAESSPAQGQEAAVWLAEDGVPRCAPLPSSNLVPFGRVAARERQGALSRRAR